MQHPGCRAAAAPVEDLLAEATAVAVRLEGDQQWLAALEFRLRALELCREHYGEQSAEVEGGFLDIAELTLALCEEHLTHGNVRDARRYLTELASMTSRPLGRARTNRRRVVLRARMFLAYAALKRSQGSARSGMRYAERAAAILLKLGCTTELPHAYLNLCALNSVQGLHHEALRYAYLALRTVVQLQAAEARHSDDATGPPGAHSASETPPRSHARSVQQAPLPWAEHLARRKCERDRRLQWNGRQAAPEQAALRLQCWWRRVAAQERAASIAAAAAADWSPLASPQASDGRPAPGIGAASPPPSPPSPRNVPLPSTPGAPGAPAAASSSRDGPSGVLTRGALPSELTALCYHNIAVEQEHCGSAASTETYRAALLAARRDCGEDHPITRQMSAALAAHLQAEARRRRLGSAPPGAARAAASRREELQRRRRAVQAAWGLEARRVQQLWGLPGGGSLPLWALRPAPASPDTGEPCSNSAIFAGISSISASGSDWQGTACGVLRKRARPRSAAAARARRRLPAAGIAAEPTASPQALGDTVLPPPVKAIAARPAPKQRSQLRGRRLPHSGAAVRASRPASVEVNDSVVSTLSANAGQPEVSFLSYRSGSVEANDQWLRECLLSAATGQAVSPGLTETGSQCEDADLRFLGATFSLGLSRTLQPALAPRPRCNTSPRPVLTPRGSQRSRKALRAQHREAHLWLQELRPAPGVIY
eukprot:TRINITY_DN10676_c0_g1_i3.p1 TRINITY_DN10676_c0_g1~~TRINITY_DN10676_c0_g1_i3.p1  ORF type:complete len:737 (+),score=104.62 TRINITY_DN10676_c0_g1_i3:72-2213(+)